MRAIVYRTAKKSDLRQIIAFVDFWLAGRGLSDDVPGSASDFFVPPGRHEKYISKYKTVLCLYEGSIIAWAVTTHKSVLIHLLVAGTFRGSGIGSKMLKLMDPDSVRSKIDQTAGNPAKFYNKNRYHRSSRKKVGHKKNIEIFYKDQVI